MNNTTVHLANATSPQRFSFRPSQKVPNYLLSVDRLGTDKLFSDRKVQSVSNTLHSFALLNCPAPNLARRAENDKSFLKHLMKHGSAQVREAERGSKRQIRSVNIGIENHIRCYFVNVAHSAKPPLQASPLILTLSP